MQADLFFEEAVKKSSPKWFFQKVNHNLVGDLFTKAGSLYKCQKNKVKAAEAFSLATESYQKAQNISAVIDSILSTSICFKHDQPEKACQLIQQAVNLLIDDGQIHRAGLQLKLKAEILETIFDQLAIDCYFKASELFVDSMFQENQCLIKIINILLRLKRYDEAQKIYEKIAKKSNKFLTCSYLFNASLCALAHDLSTAKRDIYRFKEIFEGSLEEKFLTKLLECLNDPDQFSQEVYNYDRVKRLTGDQIKILVHIKRSLSNIL